MAARWMNYSDWVDVKGNLGNGPSVPAREDADHGFVSDLVPRESFAAMPKALALWSMAFAGFVSCVFLLRAVHS